MNAVVLELQRSDYRDLSMASATELGKALAAFPETIGVWIADDGDPTLRGTPRLQFAVLDQTGRDAAESIWALVEHLQKQLSVPLAVAYFDARRPGLVPQLVAQQLGITVAPNHARIVSVIKQPRA